MRWDGTEDTDFHLQGGEQTLARSHSHSPDRSGSNEHYEITPDNSHPVASAPQSIYKADHIANVTELPVGDACGERPTRPDDCRQLRRRFDDVSSSSLWTPFWLRKGTLIAFVVLYVLLLASVAVLWRTARDNEGFTPRISTNHYTWTYGPTAVFIIVVSLWRQVEYHCKSLAPRHEMRQGAEASRSLLLDYVSPFQFTTLWLAVRHGTVSVIAAIIAFACLKLIVSQSRTPL